MIPRVQRRFVDSITVESVDAGASAAPSVDLYRNSSSPADDDILGYVAYTGEDDAGNVAEYARLAAQATDVSNGAEAGSLVFYGMNSGTLTQSGTLTGAGLLTVAGGIAAEGSTATFGASGVSPTVSVATGGNNLNVRNANANKSLNLDYPSSNGTLKVRTGTTSVTQWDDDGVFTHNTQSGGTQDFNIKGDTDADLFYVDVSTERVGVSIGGASIKHRFDCRGSRGYAVSQQRPSGASGSYTLGEDDAIIHADAGALESGGTLTITLPTIAKGRIYEVYRRDDGSGGQSVVVTAPSGTNLNGSDGGSVTLSTQHEGVRIVGVSSSDDWIAHEMHLPSGGVGGG